MSPTSGAGPNGVGSTVNTDGYILQVVGKACAKPRIDIDENLAGAIAYFYSYTKPYRNKDFQKSGFTH